MTAIRDPIERRINTPNNAKKSTGHRAAENGSLLFTPTKSMNWQASPWSRYRIFLRLECEFLRRSPTSRRFYPVSERR